MCIYIYTCVYIYIYIYIAEPVDVQIDELGNNTIQMYQFIGMINDKQVGDVVGAAVAEGGGQAGACDVYIYIYIHMCVYIYTHVCAYIYIYIHM